MKKLIAGTLAYTITTFALAILWHIVLLKDFYTSVGYFAAEPNFFLGFTSILIQGALITYGFTKVKTTSLKYVAFLGIFFWTSHVLAFMAKAVTGSLLNFLILETLYLTLQFGACAGWLKLIFKA